MTTYDATRADCRLFTFKEGLLSAIAHDLELRVNDLEVSIADDGAITARFEVPSIRVVDARVDGRTTPGVLSPKDKTKIESNIVRDVFKKRRDPIQLRGQRNGDTIEAELTMAGRTAPVRVTVEETETTWTARARLHQPDWGIKPFSAMMGTLKIQPDVDVELTITR